MAHSRNVAQFGERSDRPVNASKQPSDGIANPQRVRMPIERKIQGLNDAAILAGEFFARNQHEADLGCDRVTSRFEQRAHTFDASVRLAGDRRFQGVSVDLEPDRSVRVRLDQRAKHLERVRHRSGYRDGPFGVADAKFAGNEFGQERVAERGEGEGLGERELSPLPNRSNEFIEELH